MITNVLFLNCGHGIFWSCMSGKLAWAPPPVSCLLSPSPLQNQPGSCDVIVISFFKFLFNFYYIFPLPFISFVPPPSHNQHTVLHVHESFFPFLFAQFSHPPTPLSAAAVLLSIYESLFIFLVSSVCSLESTYEWNHMVFSLLWLAYFI